MTIRILTVPLAVAACVLALSGPVSAQTLRIAATEDLAHYDIDVIVSDVANVIAVRIDNADPMPVRCTVTIDSGPDSVVRRVRLDSGDVRTVSYGIRRVSTRVVGVSTVCRGADTDDE